MEAALQRVEKLDTLSPKCRHFGEGMQAPARTAQGAAHW